jgi:hypothetical protein
MPPVILLTLVLRALKDLVIPSVSAEPDSDPGFSASEASQAAIVTAGASGFLV